MTDEQKELAAGIEGGDFGLVDNNLKAGITNHHIKLVVQSCNRDFPNTEVGKQDRKISRDIAEIVINNAGIDALKEPYKTVPYASDISVQIDNRLQFLRETARRAEKEAGIISKDRNKSNELLEVKINSEKELSDAIKFGDEGAVDRFVAIDIAKKETPGIINTEHLKTAIETFDAVESRVINRASSKNYRILEKLINAARKPVIKEISRSMHQDVLRPEDKWVTNLSSKTKEVVLTLVDQAITKIKKQEIEGLLSPDLSDRAAARYMKPSDVSQRF